MSLLRLYPTGLVLLLLWIPLFAQDTTRTQTNDTGIEITAFVTPDPVAQNRSAKLTVRLMWYGDLDRYDIHPLDTPIIENFELQGSGSANRINVQDGRRTAVREYTYTLNPQAMGMAYVEGMILTYTDLETDTDFRLVTQRIPVQVVEPVKESGGWPWTMWVILAGVLVGGLGAGGYLYRRRRIAETGTEDVSVALEQVFQQELVSEVDLNDPNLNTAEAYIYLSRLLRRFLSQKFDLPGLEATTPELLNGMRSKGFSASFTDSVGSILELADAVKFSGKRIGKQDMDQCYLRIESILDKSSKQEIEQFFENSQNNSINE
ncbi:MAG: hypothetical protein U5R06_24025 [candidate division KSB1 bacterium]|nr:hypothetical protein [candidate division KSB1 bacterium]